MASLLRSRHGLRKLIPPRSVRLVCLRAARARLMSLRDVRAIPTHRGSRLPSFLICRSGMCCAVRRCCSIVHHASPCLWFAVRDLSIPKAAKDLLKVIEAVIVIVVIAVIVVGLRDRLRCAIGSGLPMKWKAGTGRCYSRRLPRRISGIRWCEKARSYTRPDLLCVLGSLCILNMLVIDLSDRPKEQREADSHQTRASALTEVVPDRSKLELSVVNLGVAQAAVVPGCVAFTAARAAVQIS